MRLPGQTHTHTSGTGQEWIPPPRAVLCSRSTAAASATSAPSSKWGQLPPGHRGAVRARRKALLPSHGSGARASPFQAGLLHCRPSCMGLGHLCWGAGLGTVGCLGASLASTWPTPVAPPPPCTCENKDVSEHGQMFPSGAKPHPDGRARHIVSRCSEMSRSSTLKSQALQVHVYTSPPGIAEVPRDKMGALSPPISISLSPHTPSKHTILEFLNLRTAG